MLQIDEDVRFIATAQVKLKAAQYSFQVECKLLDNDVLLKLRDDQKEGRITVAEFIQNWLTGWPAGEVQAADGTDVPFSEAAVQRLLNKPGVPMALVEAFYDGYDLATEGNSAPLPAGS